MSSLHVVIGSHQLPLHRLFSASSVHCGRLSKTEQPFWLLYSYWDVKQPINGCASWKSTSNINKFFFFTLPVKVVHKSLHCSIDFLTYFERALPTQVIALFATNITFVYLLSWVLLHDQFMWDSILLKEKSDGYIIKTLRISNFEGHVKLKMFPFFSFCVYFTELGKGK